MCVAVHILGETAPGAKKVLPIVLVNRVILEAAEDTILQPGANLCVHWAGVGQQLCRNYEKEVNLWEVDAVRDGIDSEEKINHAKVAQWQQLFSCAGLISQAFSGKTGFCLILEHETEATPKCMVKTFFGLKNRQR